jgi:glucose-6-phosphate 1-dehydrogenase
MNEYVIIIFGASGDLVRRKLIPALYSLIAKYDAKKFCIIGAAFDNTSAHEILIRAKEGIADVREDIWARFEASFFYRQLDFKKKEDYIELQKYIDGIKKELHLEQANTMIYLAASAVFFAEITRLCAQTGIAKRHAEHDAPWTRLVYEKPFGFDMRSSHVINDCIDDYFDEHQIYRIDHYLTKELVSNIALLRFTNLIFEPLWNNRYIDNVQIILSEKDSIGNRGLYYDNFGAVSDVMQNHMLELLALIGMEAPEKLTGDYVRDQRVKVLDAVEVVDTFFGQYALYRQEEFVAQDSCIETFAVAYLRIVNERWSGVPFYLKTGKCLDKKETVIHIKFKAVDCLLARCPTDANVLTIQISPQAGFTLSLNAKKPGNANEIIPASMNFCHSCIFGSRDEQAYETLLESVITGEKSVSVRFDEIEAAWKIIDAIKAKQHDVYSYECGSEGPPEMDEFNKKHGIRWLS